MTEFLLHMITIKIILHIIICYNHNHIIKLVKFFRRGVLGAWGAVALAAFPTNIQSCLRYMFDFKILFAILFIISDEIFQLSHSIFII